MTESESVALPLGDTPSLGWVMGFEPTHDGATTRCLNHLTTPTTVSAFSRNTGEIIGDPDRDRTDDLQRDRLAF